LIFGVKFRDGYRHGRHSHSDLSTIVPRIVSAISGESFQSKKARAHDFRFGKSSYLSFIRSRCFPLASRTPILQPPSSSVDSLLSPTQAPCRHAIEQRGYAIIELSQMADAGPDQIGLAG
jgi:hypothetical protein